LTGNTQQVLHYSKEQTSRSLNAYQNYKAVEEQAL